jgi:peptide/nickel transport system ATP-binding protein
MMQDHSAVPVLEVEGLSVTLRSGQKLVEDVSFSIARGRTLAIVGESGSGKSLSAMATLGIIPDGASVTGSVRLNGTELLQGRGEEMRRLRGREIAMTFQEPRRSLDPSFTVGDQIAELARRHLGLSRRDAWTKALEMLHRVGIIEPERRARDYPHQFSGGMCQRVLIAMALVATPQVLIADEATTALDVTIQAQILEMIKDLQREMNLAVIFITHDLGVVAQMADDVAVMYAGEIVEYATCDDLFTKPSHPYTQALLDSLPQRGQGRLVSIRGRMPLPSEWPQGCRFAPRCAHVKDICREAPVALIDHAAGSARCVLTNELHLTGIHDNTAPEPHMTERAHPAGDSPAAVLRGVGLGKSYTSRHLGRRLSTRVVDDVSLEVGPGETLGLVGESGAGKSTIGRMLLHLVKPDEGEVTLEGQPLAEKSSREQRAMRARARMIFQDPFSSLDPRMTVGAAVAESLSIHTKLGAKETHQRVIELFERVGLLEIHLDRYPREFSGGQLQRVAIARAIAPNPSVIICDEPVAALDMSIRAQVLNLLLDLQQERDIALVFISHDLSLVRLICQRVVVLRHGRIVEQGTTEEVYGSPQNSYTQALLAAIPQPDPRHKQIHVPTTVLEVEGTTPALTGPVGT